MHPHGSRPDPPRSEVTALEDLDVATEYVSLSGVKVERVSATRVLLGGTVSLDLSGPAHEENPPPGPSHAEEDMGLFCYLEA